MITREEARRIAQEHIGSWRVATKGDSWITLDEWTIEKDWGWVFFYTSRLWHETGDIRYALAGNSPFIVERDSGRLLVLGTAFGVEHYLDLYEKHGDPHFEPSNHIRLAECPPEFDRLAAIKFVRDRSGLGLQAARQIIEDCIAGRRPSVSAADLQEAEQLARDLESLGFTIGRLPRSGEPDGPANAVPPYH